MNRQISDFTAYEIMTSIKESNPYAVTEEVINITHVNRHTSRKTGKYSNGNWKVISLSYGNLYYQKTWNGTIYRRRFIASTRPVDIRY